MADTVSLREYLDELNRLLENESPTEVVSHCRYILQHFPQNVETYRLLGKALLQKGHQEGVQEYLEEAAEVFLRVLSVLPNDPITHLGLSEIRERDGDLDRAIWHLERAYEQLPGNTLLQGALHDLYARRDGEDRVPDKVQLTRSGLARQFANSNLYEQALIELRAAIEQDPQRTDLHVLLAEILWESGHPVEAAETAVQVLKKLPNNITANRIMASLWLDYERPTDAQMFLDRLEALDPYEAARLIQPEGDAPDPNRLARLDYNAKATAELSAETPSWVHDLDDFGESAAMEDLFLAPSEAVSEEAGLPHGPDRIDTDAVFGMPYSAGEQDAWMGQPATGAELPDWFGGMNWDAGAEQAAPPSLDEWPLPEQAAIPGEPPAEDELPDWFAEMSGMLPDEQTPAESSGWPEPSAEADLQAASADWLLDADETGESEALPPWDAPLDDSTPVWTSRDPGAMAPDAFPPPDDEAPADDGLAPDWLTEDEQAEPESADRAVAEESPVIDAQDTSADDWLAALDVAAETAPGTGELAPDWMAEETPRTVPAESDQVPGDEQPASAEDWFDVLREVAGEDLLPAETGPEDVGSWLAGDEVLPEDAVAEDEIARGFSDYLSEVRETRQTGDLPEPNDVIEDEAPEWAALADVAAALAAQEMLPDEAVPVSEEDQGAEEWRGASAPDADVAEITGAGAETAPDWWAALADESPASDELAEDILPEDYDESIGEEETLGEPTGGIGASPEWMTEPEYDFFAPTPQADISGTLQPAEDWPSMPDELEASADADDGEAEPGGLPWLETAPAATDDDWLRSFALEQAENEPQPDAEPDVAPEEVEAAADWRDEAQGVVGVAAEAVEEAEAWLTDASEAEPVTEAVADWQNEAQGVVEVAADTAEEAEAWLADASEAEPVTEAVADWQDEAQGVAEEAADTAEEAEAWLAGASEAEPLAEEDYQPIGEVPDDRETVGELEPAGTDELETRPAAAPETADPAWMADIEPLETPETGEAERVAGEAFSLDMDEENASYGSADDTGVLQPDEVPDWMMAFTDEDLAEAGLPAELDEAGWDTLSEEATEAGSDEVQPTNEQLADLAFDEAEYAASDDEGFSEAGDGPATLEGEVETSEGAIPEWLMAITSSESDKLDDGLFDEAEQYSQTAEETGVLQPSTTPDWLMSISETSSADVELEEPETGFDEFAQPDDLAHTNVAESGTGLAELEDSDEFAEAEPDEDVPADFSFDDQPPAWLRRPKESDLAGPQAAPQDRASELPEWLRDVMEEDDDSIE